MGSGNVAHLLVGLFLMLFCSVYPTTVRGQQCSRARPCQPGYCCGQNGYCGITKSYCLPAKCEAGCWPQTVPPSKRMRATYWRRESGASGLKNINAKLFTHIFYAFATVDTKTSKITPLDPSETRKSGLWSSFTAAVKKGNPKCKAILSVGTQTYSRGPFFQEQDLFSVAEVQSKRVAFAQNAVQVLRTYGFDGLDLVFHSGLTATEKGNIAELFSSIRSAFDRESLKSKRPRLLLTAAVPVDRDTIEGYPIVRMNKLLDVASVMCYEFGFDWEQTGINTAVWNEASPDLSCIGGMRAWTKGGLSASKILMVLAINGKSWTLVNKKNHDIGDKASKPDSNEAEGARFMSFPKVKSFLESGATAVYHDESLTMYAFKGKQWVSYENKWSIWRKVGFAKERGVRGYIFWAWDFDDDEALARLAYTRSLA